MVKLLKDAGDIGIRIFSLKSCCPVNEIKWEDIPAEKRSYVSK
jgi:hypothetical protein